MKKMQEIFFWRLLNVLLIAALFSYALLTGAAKGTMKKIQAEEDPGVHCVCQMIIASLSKALGSLVNPQTHCFCVV